MFPSRIRDATRRASQPQRVCQRCEQPGHAIYDCKNPRPYKSRPTRAQTFGDPKLARRFLPTAVEEDIRHKGLADKVLVEKERARQERGWFMDRNGQGMRRSASPSPPLREQSRGYPDHSTSRSPSPESHPESCSTCSPQSHPSSCSTCTGGSSPARWNEYPEPSANYHHSSPHLHDKHNVNDNDSPQQ